MSGTTTGAGERLAFASLATLILVPVVLQGLWRPLAVALRADADPVAVTGSALLVVTAVMLSSAGGRTGWFPTAMGGLVAVTLGAMLGAAHTIALLGVAAFCGGLLPWLLRRLPPELDGLAHQRKGAALWIIVLAVAALAYTTRLSVFMGDASHPELSMLPDVPLLVHHSCLTAYVEGARLATEGVENLYDLARWPALNGTPRAVSEQGHYAPFGLDAFGYPPPFLLLPRLVLGPFADFASARAVWFSLNGLVVAVGLWTVAAWLGGAAGLRALVLAVAVWVSPPTLFTLQVGNVHLVVMVAAMLALVAFETRRPALGGALLAFAILSKISPALLLLVLFARGRHREVLWTAAFGLALVLLGLLVFGSAPFVAFVAYELPRLGSGEALTFLAEPETIPINLAPFGIPFKLGFLGVQVGEPWAVARTIGRVYGVVLVGLTLLAARRSGGPRATAEVWAAVLTLASLESPLAPTYASFSLLWLLSFAAIEVRGAGRALLWAGIWIFVACTPPLTPVLLVTYTLPQQTLVLGAAVWFLVRRVRGETAAAR